MVYIGRTFKYMFGMFWVLAPVCLPAALLLGIFTVPMSSLTYFVPYANTYVNGFFDIFWLIFNRYATVYVYPLVLIFLSLLFCVSLALSGIEKHFRVGKAMLRAPLRQINNYILPVLSTLLILSLIIAVYGFVQSGLITLLHMIISGRGYPNVPGIVIAAIVSYGLFALAVFAVCSFMYWVPNMVIYGFSFRDAAASSLRLIDGKTGGIFFGLLLPFIIVSAVQTLMSFVGNVYILKAVAVILYLFLIVYIVSFVMISMFGLSGMERRDKFAEKGGNASGV